MGKFKLNRKEYRYIRTLDHKQMEEHFYHTYKSGYEEGKKAAAPSVKLSDIEDAVRAIKGIGIKKTAEIMNAINALYKEGKENVDGTGRESGAGRI